MAKNDWYEAGDQIRKIVQDAVESGDYTQLGNTIGGVVNEASPRPVRGRRPV